MFVEKQENDERKFIPMTNRILRVKSRTRKNLYHIVNIDKNVCSCENYQYEGLQKGKFDFRCAHIIMAREWLCIANN